MYKFNFLQKINLQKQESSQRNKFITTVFMMSVSAQIILLGLLFLKSLSVNSSYDDAIVVKNKIDKLTKDFRKKDFFGYKNINHVYNVQVARKQFSYIFNSFETSLDTTMIIEKFFYDDSYIKLEIISRTTAVKSRLMSQINQLKSRISDKLIKENYIAKSSDLQLVSGPDLRSKSKNEDDTQYWLFSISMELVEIKPKVKKKDVKNSHDVNI